MLQQRLVAFLDIIGFKEAVNSADQETFSKIYAILSSFAASNKNFEMQIETKRPGHKTIRSNPAVSSFSDHIVISVPFRVKKDDEYHPISLSLSHLQNQIARICYLVLQHGFLIRGGLTVGEIHHDKNIVYGRALVEAVEIESELARYPRIIVADQVLSLLAQAGHLNSSFELGQIRKDFDGLNYVDWINDWKFKLGGERTYNWEVFGNKLVPIKSIIEKNLKLFEDKQRFYKNWYWMAKYFNASLEQLTSSQNTSPPDQNFLPKIKLP